MNSRYVAATAALALSVGTVAALAPRDGRSTSRSCSTVLTTEVCTWVVTEGGEAVELGASIPMTLITSVPADAEMVWPPEELGAVELPPEARRLLGIDHLGINWEAHGHPPTTFLTPHFDFHLYNITRADVRAIDCTDETKPSRLPARYALPDVDVPGLGMLVGMCVPRMGMHAALEGEIDDTAPFEASLMLGYYGGVPIFYEPMVSRELLLRKADFTLPMPTVEDLPPGVRYPTRFRAEYDPAEQQYRLIFTGFAS